MHAEMLKEKLQRKRESDNKFSVVMNLGYLGGRQDGRRLECGRERLCGCWVCGYLLCYFSLNCTCVDSYAFCTCSHCLRKKAVCASTAEAVQ